MLRANELPCGVYGPLSPEQKHDDNRDRCTRRTPASSAAAATTLTPSAVEMIVVAERFAADLSTTSNAVACRNKLDQGLDE